MTETLAWKRWRGRRDPRARLWLLGHYRHLAGVTILRSPCKLSADERLEHLPAVELALWKALESYDGRTAFRTHAIGLMRFAFANAWRDDCEGGRRDEQARESRGEGRPVEPLTEAHEAVEAGGASDVFGDPARICLRRWERRAALDAAAALTGDTGTVVRCRLGGMTCSETRAAMGLSKAQEQALYQRAVRAMRREAMGDR